jgi:hypothetical protein
MGLGKVHDKRGRNRALDDQQGRAVCRRADTDHTDDADGHDLPSGYRAANDAPNAPVLTSHGCCRQAAAATTRALSCLGHREIHSGNLRLPCPSDEGSGIHAPRRWRRRPRSANSGCAIDAHPRVSGRTAICVGHHLSHGMQNRGQRSAPANALPPRAQALHATQRIGNIAILIIAERLYRDAAG